MLHSCVVIELLVYNVAISGDIGTIMETAEESTRVVGTLM